MDGLKEECGVVGVYQMGPGATGNASAVVVRALLDLQSRGQLSAGLTSYNPHRNRVLQTHKGVGSVHEVFRLNDPAASSRLMHEYSGVAAIGHNRYATSGEADAANAQPFERVHGRKFKWFAIAFNGNLANYDDLKAQLESHGYHITYHSDTEVMMHYLNREMRGDDPPQFTAMFANLTQVFDGAFNIAFLNAEGDMVVMRDPLGIKPMCYGVRGNLLVAASESVVLTNLGIEDYRFLEPGELLVANPQGYRVERFWPVTKKAHCYFEWVYFANLASNLDGRSVYNVRHAVGRELAAMETLQEREGFLVVPVPETASTAANSFAFHLGLPVANGLLRNRYVGRTFIDGATRQDTLSMKFIPMREVLDGKKIFLVDDTLVRGTTLKTVISTLRERGGAKEIHVRISSPAIMGPCFYGIDMPTVKELFAPAYLGGQPVRQLPPQVLARMAHDLGADSLIYLSMDALVRALGVPKQDLCMACINTAYPTVVGGQRYLQALADAGLAPDATRLPPPQAAD
ncbi:MAG TPA: amidophosphoribosyltransferase [bacterium]|nr:amidophosphoribosyltransferase [bacterium]